MIERDDMFPTGGPSIPKDVSIGREQAIGLIQWGDYHLNLLVDSRDWVAIVYIAYLRGVVSNE